MERTERDLVILRNMVAELTDKEGNPFGKTDRLTKDSFNDTVADELSHFLSNVKATAENRQYAATKMKDKIYDDLVEKLGSREALVQLQMDNHNKRLEEYLLNKNELDKIIESKSGRLIQQKDPAYHIARFTNGRAHFYAPVKRIGGLEINTFLFNIIFIWITTLFCYVALKYTWLKRLLGFLSGLKIMKK